MLLCSWQCSEPVAGEKLLPQLQPSQRRPEVPQQWQMWPPDVEIGFLAATSTAVADRVLAGSLSAVAAALSVMGVPAREDNLVKLLASMVAAAVPLVVALFSAVAAAFSAVEVNTACDTLPMGASA